MGDIDYWFDEYSKEVNQYTQSLERAKTLIDSSNLKASEGALKDCELKSNRIKEVKKSFGMEVRLLKDKELRNQFETKARALEELFNNLTKEYTSLKAKINKQELLGGSSTTGGRDYYSTEGKDNDTLLAEANKIQDLTFASLARSKNMIEASKEVGAATLEQLRGQREQIIEIENEIDKIDSNLVRAGMLVKNFTRRMATDRIIQGCTAVNIVVMLALILYVAISGKSLAGGGGSNGAFLGPATSRPSMQPTFRPTQSPFSIFNEAELIASSNNRITEKGSVKHNNKEQYLRHEKKPRRSKGKHMRSRK